MTFIQLTEDSLSLTRFALSPLAETLATITEGHRGNDPQWDWLHHQPVADGLLSLLTHTKFIPDIVAIPPAGLDTRIDDELELMAGIGDDHAYSTLTESRHESWDTRDPAWMEYPDIARRIADVFAQAWRQIEPDWPRRRTILERDIRYRAGLIATGGWQKALSGISPKVQWAGNNRIQFSHQPHQGPTVGAEGLRLVPHTAGTGRWLCEAPPLFAMAYPARGVLMPVPPAGGVQKLIGTTRAAIIDLAQEPVTPSGLAVILDKSFGTISGHLAALEDAGVVEKVRVGRAVNYTLTQRGRDLLGTFA